MGTKKAVYSETMGLGELYGAGERRCERPAVEWSVDSKMNRKIRVLVHITGTQLIRVAANAPA